MERIIPIIISIPTAFLLSVLLGRVVIPWLRALKAGQSIREIGPSWHNSKAGTPAMGGIIFIAASLICVITGIGTGEWTHVLVLAFALAFGAVGFADDYIKVTKKRNEGLTALQKSGLQLVVSAVYLFVLYLTGHLTCCIWVPFTNVSWDVGSTTAGVILYIAFAVFVIVGCVNAVNLTDGIDGLATGVTIPVMIFFLLTCIGMKKLSLALFPAALLGGLGGFLCYNFHPAKTFMGDTGSLFLGGAVCGLAFALDMPLILLLVGIVYIVETVSVIMQVSYFKLTHGKRIFKMTPIHHHFELCGWSEVRIWVVFVTVSVVFCTLAYLGVQPLLA